MKTPVKLATYVAILGVVFAAAAGLGNLAGPVAAGALDHKGKPMTTTHGTSTHSSGASAPAGSGVGEPAGLQVTQDGYALVPHNTALPAAGGTYAFRIIDGDGRPVTEYTPSHDKNLHLIVVRRDLAGLTLGTDLFVAGTSQQQPLPAVARTATVDGYTVTLAGDLRPGTSSKLTLTVSREGRPVTDLQPYLAAFGHLVALRAADLAYLHVHPDGAPGDGKTRSGPEITFYAEVPTTGAYRLYLDFQHGGVVRTAEFTATAGHGHGG